MCTPTGGWDARPGQSPSPQEPGGRPRRSRGTRNHRRLAPTEQPHCSFDVCVAVARPFTSPAASVTCWGPALSWSVANLPTLPCG
eukprot:scaffold653_cov345-Pavlova_lutheri.AAC.3